MVRDRLSRLGEWIKRSNQVILTAPVWLVLGVSGLLHRIPGAFRTDDGPAWERCDRNERYRRMY